MSQAISQTMNQQDNRPISESGGRSMDESVGQSANEAAKQSIINQSVFSKKPKHPLNQSANEGSIEAISQ